MSQLARAPITARHIGGESPQDIVRRRFGLVIHDHQQAGFERTLDHLTRALGYSSRDAYLEALARVERGAPEVEGLLSAITVGESYFFRDVAQLEFIERRWIPGVMARKRDGERTVRVWSAGCSRGQEIYTIAMLLERHLPGGQRWDLQLVGTDINREALDAAAAGRYSEWSLRATPAWARAQFFEQRGHEWLLTPRVRSMGKFEYFNLVADRSPWAPGGGESFDLILCRNVFIYFDRDAVRSVMSRFARCLHPDGVLLLGPADIVAERCQGLELESWKRAQYYSPRHSDRAETRGQATTAPVARAVPPCRVARPGFEAGPGRFAQHTAPHGIEVEELLRDGAWEAAATEADSWIARHGEAAQMLERTARAKASLGRLDEAMVALERCLALEPLNRNAHFIHALVLMERGEPDAAEAALRRAVYVDNGFLEAHYHLGSLLLRQGRRNSGLKSLRNALAIAQRAEVDGSLELLPDVTFPELLETLRGELATHGSATEGDRA